ncbi:MAG: hypothetical protein AAGD04_07000 [Pseudomonadota bacterium]
MLFTQNLKNTTIGLVLLAALPAAAAAEEICRFTTECFEGEACSETAFDMTIAGDKLITDAETIPVSTGGSATKNVFVGYTASAFHVLTREKEGAARYSTHLFEGLMMVNYMGTCTSK